MPRTTTDAVVAAARYAGLITIGIMIVALLARDRATFAANFARSQTASVKVTAD
jgi:hypothetical protein